MQLVTEELVMRSDIEIVQENTLLPIVEIAKKIAIAEDELECYGTYKAKLTMKKLRELQTIDASHTAQKSQRGRLILVTAITPTPAGEGKSTVSIGLGDGLNKIGKKAVIALREPSLGPCFGVKGGACGGGYAQIVPMEEINLHFTGDIHAVSIANNLIAALIDNHIQQGNELGIDARTITWKRCVDLNDRELRAVVVGLGGKTNGVVREEHFCISVASEIMAIVCLSRTISELKEKLSNIVIAQNMRGEFVRFDDLHCTGAVAALLKDALRPNIVQTLEKTPVFVHGGPFANIAHGCNSINATLAALALSDYVVTEAGFAADLGAEKFMDIKCRMFNLAPTAIVVVATVRALKMHGGVEKTRLFEQNARALAEGFANLKTHLENIAQFGVPALVAINKFSGDTQEELDTLISLCESSGARAVVCEAWEKGGKGAVELAHAVDALCESTTAQFHMLYEDALPLKEKIEKIAKDIYRAGSVAFEASALKKLKKFEESGYGAFPVCIAKTQSSLSHNASLRGAPFGYVFPVKDVQLYAGAGFVVALAGDVMVMPGLPKLPAALNIDVGDDGKIVGLF